MSWYKKTLKESWNTGIPLMDQYTEKRDIPSSADYKKDPRSLVNAVPEFGGNRREGYPTGTSSRDEEMSESEKNKKLPGENVLMDQDPPTGEGIGSGDEFTARGEGNSDNDVIPNDVSRSIDKGRVGPHNMMNRNVFLDTKKKYRVRGINTI
jgi:hypothetical protein